MNPDPTHYQADAAAAHDPRDGTPSAESGVPGPSSVRPEKVAAALRSLQANRYDDDGVISAAVERLYAAITSTDHDAP